MTTEPNTTTTPWVPLSDLGVMVTADASVKEVMSMLDHGTHYDYRLEQTKCREGMSVEDCVRVLDEVIRRLCTYRRAAKKTDRISFNEEWRRPDE